jgi:hypothetical protein
MMSNQELRSLDERTAKVAEKLAERLEAHRRGEVVRLAEALALISGLRDELPAEAIEEWKRNYTGDWEREAAAPKPSVVWGA